MRAVILASAIVAGFGATALAAPPDWLGDLLGTRSVVQHRDRPPAKRAAAKTPAPSVPRPAPPLSAAAAGSPRTPMPLPRPADAPGASTGPAPAAPAREAAPAPASPAPPAPHTAPAPAATPAKPPPASQEGESAAPQPPRVYQTACPAVIGGLVAAKPLPPISDGPCHEQSPLAVTGLAVNGRMVPLSGPATVDCEMASDLPGWVAAVDDFAETMLKSRITAVTVGGSFECRPRNTPDSADTSLSEHGRADAVDVVGFRLADGRTLTVGTDYNSGDARTARFMHFAHDAACTRFTTVLGPDANSLHHNHFHLDLGCHGQSCTFRLCE